MGIRQVLAGAAVAAAVSACAVSAAEAKVMDVVYTGTVVQMTDVDGLFGTQPLAGLNFVARFTYDSTLGYEIGLSGADGEFHSGTGSHFFPSPILSSSLSLNGRTYHFEADQDGFAETVNSTALLGFPQGVVSERVQHQKTVGNAVVQSDFHFTLYNGSVPDRLDIPFSGAPDNDAGGPSIGVFQIFTFDFATQDTTFQVDGAFALDHVDITAGVPEPAAWGLMLLGLGGAGAALRRRRAAAATA
jgi:hypothetical protein